MSNNRKKGTIISTLDAISNFDNIGGLKRKTFRSRFITPYVKRVRKAIYGPFRKFSPSRQWRNLKHRVGRRIGYYSAPAKAYRHAKTHGVSNTAKKFALRGLVGK